MKANLYVQGHYYATIDVPGDSLLSLLAQGMITQAALRCTQLKADLETIGGVQCSISLQLQTPVAYSLPEEKQP